MVAEVAAPVAVVPYWTHLTPILIALIGAIQVLGLGFIAAKFGGAKREIIGQLDQVKASAADTATSVEKVHVAVNSERTAMMDEVRKLRLEILELSKDKAKSEQKADDAKETKAAADAAPPSTAPVNMTVEKMEVAELNVPEKDKK